MALAAFQRALATLYVDARARADFTCDPAAFARQFRLDDRECEWLLAFGEAHAADYARTLARKRRNELARLAPRTAKALGSAFASTVDRYTSEISALPGRSLRDALGFLRFVRSDASLEFEIREMSRTETRTLRG